jgi:hypothetical protein
MQSLHVRSGKLRQVMGAIITKIQATHD